MTEQITLISEIKARHLQARKDRDPFTLRMLTTFIGEAEAIGKKSQRTVNDAEVIDLLKTFIKGIDDSINALTATGDRRISGLELEKKLFNEFLPKQLSENELKDIIAEILKKETSPNLGSIMKSLKAEHNGLYDGKVASELIKQILAS